MNISDDLILSQPAGPNWSWTLASRFAHMLEDAQQQFGPRDNSYTPVGIEFVAVSNPYIWYVAGGRYVIVRLTASCATDTVQACYQLAHECVHLLSPTGGADAKVLEEGTATVFAGRYTINNFSTLMNPATARYVDAARAVEELRGIDVDAIRKVRQHQPNFSQITTANLLNVCPKCPVELAERLVQPF